jgi:hypothetical protein
LILFLATLLVCWGAGPALANEGEEAAVTENVQAAVDFLDTTQLAEVSSSVLDAAAQTPSTNEPANETGADTDDTT